MPTKHLVRYRLRVERRGYPPQRMSLTKREREQLRKSQHESIVAAQMEQERRRELEREAMAARVEEIARSKEIAKMRERSRVESLAIPRGTTPVIIHGLVSMVEDSPRTEGASACYWCGIPYDPRDPNLARTREHLVPRALGGSRIPNNIVFAHKRCNNLRGTNTRWVPFDVHGRLGQAVVR